MHMFKARSHEGIIEEKDISPIADMLGQELTISRRQVHRDRIGRGTSETLCAQSAARKEMVESNPKLMEAFYAAMTDAAAWLHDPKNFEELVKIYTPMISFGDMAGADEIRRNWIKSVIPAYSKDLKVKVSALQELMDFSLENKIIDVKVESKRVLWDKAPQTP